MVKLKRLPGTVQLTLTPNRSLSWRQSLIIVSAIALFCLSIALVWFVLGAWLILPFAGLEVGLLLALTYLVSRATYQRQIVLLNSEYISFQSGFPSVKRQLLLNRKLAELIQYPATHPEDVFPLFLKDARQQVRLGEFLNLEDLTKLIKIMRTEGIQLRQKKALISMPF
ncbi:DUF2244 domain-containing protein [Planctobacterium marinum]|uniref:DUF2244 domain-containing protein n=1 Tax=Planctobacterium marinum TaxID=1631968 RepID=UPI001E4A1727|nr:DUF2244 domain-containing protein [Planctobacterium marinum]MCC2608200.1 DUF2244 domain-containing protein [Planctobacterium marinum]